VPPLKRVVDLSRTSSLNDVRDAYFLRPCENEYTRTEKKTQAALSCATARPNPIFSYTLVATPYFRFP
jgi:hypothetical protein